MRLFVSLLFITVLSACGTTHTPLSTKSAAAPTPIAAPTHTSMAPVVSANSDDVSELKARIEDLNNRIFVMAEQIDSLRARVKDDSPQPKPVKVKQKTEEPKEPQESKAEESTMRDYTAKEELKKEPEPKEAPEVDVKEESSPMHSMSDDYFAAYNLFKEKEYAKSMVAFSSFIDKYPNSTLTDNAYFWVGESYYQQGEYALAISEYLKGIKKFPEGSKTPESMLKVSKSYRALGEEKDADAYSKVLKSKYPNSRAAMMAK